MSQDEGMPRRSTRAKKLTAKAADHQLHHQKYKGGFSDSESDFEDAEPLVSDSVSHSNTVAIGRDIFAFEKKKKLSVLVQETPNTPEKRKDRLQSSLAAKTPHKLREKLKKGIQNVVLADSSDDEPFPESGSDFDPSGSESMLSSSESEGKNTSDESHDENDTPAVKPKRRNNLSKIKYTNMANLKQNAKSKRSEYIIKTDEYFAQHSQRKIQTSNHTLDKLNTPRLSQDQLQLLLKNMKLSNDHEQCITNMTTGYRAWFPKWLYMLHEGFNILLYGLGSKRSILQDLHSEFLSEMPVIVVNGFFPSLTLKDILDAVLVDMMAMRENSANVFDACEAIAQKLEDMRDTHLYIIIHNIEGDMLRNGKTQTALAKLAAIRNIHLIASIDHINAPLIWDHNKLSKFNFTWWDITTFLPYLSETSFESSMMVQKSGNLALSSLKNVFLSLTTNSKGIYLTIVKYQLNHQSDHYYQGMLFKDLYWACREAFLVSSDLALRAQLTEFVDHKMVKFKRSLDGAEYLVIPIQTGLLQQFIKEQQCT